MTISYEPLLHLLIRKRLKRTDLKKLAGLSTAAIAKFAKGEPMSLDIIARLCKALDCAPGDIFEIVEAKNDAPKGE